MRPQLRYALIGVLLGLGAPLGSLAWRWLSHPRESPQFILEYELETARYYYVYMTVGTVTAFSLFGLALGRKNEDLSDLSVHDGLTGVYNHRYLQEELSQEIERAIRHKSPISCLMLDVDDFKQVNDKYGHPFGDFVLRAIARLLRETVRRIDTVGRYGGEEFLVIMPQTEGSEALPIAQRIVTAVQDRPFAFKGTLGVRITVSVGLATYPLPEHGVKSKSSLLSAADQAMYKAKRQGKNQVVVWES